MVVKSKVVFEHMGDLGDIFKILKRHIGVLLVLARVNFWATWSVIVELKSNLIRLRQLIIFKPFGILKKSRS